jgi:hypothetical protein
MGSLDSTSGLDYQSIFVHARPAEVCARCLTYRRLSSSLLSMEPYVSNVREVLGKAGEIGSKLVIDWT